MANEYAVNQADLAAVADAIRAKGGTSDMLMFPGGFINAVGAIEAGGGGIELKISGKNVTGLVPFEVSNSDVTSINLRARYITKMTFPNATNIVDIRGNAELEYFTFDHVVSIGASAVSGCSSLKQVVAPELTTLTPGANFDGCYALEYVKLDVFQSFTGAYVFSNCTSLKTVILPSITNLGSSTFNSCRSLHALVLGTPDSTSVVTLGSTAVFNNTPFVGYGGTYSGHVYVPEALIPAYQAATNWAALYANYPDVFAAIEGSEYE